MKWRLPATTWHEKFFHYLPPTFVVSYGRKPPPTLDNKVVGPTGEIDEGLAFSASCYANYIDRVADGG